MPARRSKSSNQQSAALAEQLPRPRVLREMLLAGALVASLGLFLWLLAALRMGGVDSIDTSVQAWLTARRSPLLTEIALNLTALGSATLLTVGTVLLVLLLWTGGRRLAAVDAALASSLAGILTQLAKVALQRPRPPVAERLAGAIGYSFPSGHSSGIAALLTITALHSIEAAASRKQRIVLALAHALLILSVAGSRTYLGVHYLSDVAAGICIGVACGLVAYAAVRTHSIVRRLRTWLR
jgi:membrane-associated phospholipid phosphatase